MACKQIKFLLKVEQQPWSLSEKIQTAKALKQTKRQKYKAKLRHQLYQEKHTKD